MLFGWLSWPRRLAQRRAQRSLLPQPRRERRLWRQRSVQPRCATSIEIGLATLEVPSPPDRVLLAPGDAAGITRELVMRLLVESERHPGGIIVPRCGGRGGHPVVLPWNIAQEVALLPPGQGASALLARHPSLVIDIPVADSRIADDIDTPEDFRRWRNGSDGADDDFVESRDAERARSGTWTRVRVSFFALCASVLGARRWISSCRQRVE